MAMSTIQGTSNTKESDAIPGMFCEHCDNEGKYATATGFCVDCTEFMCDVCMKYHKKYKSKHITQSKDHMPHDYCFEKCSVHSDKCIKFYCDECSSFACSKCVSTKEKSHKQDCKLKTWTPVHIAVQNTDGEFYTRIKEEGAKTVSEINRMEDKILSMRQNWQKCNEQVRESITFHRKQLEKRIIDHERTFLRKVDEKESNFNASLDSVSSDVSAIKIQLDYAAASYPRKLNQSRTRCSKFIAMTEYRSSVYSIRNDLHELPHIPAYTDYAFEASESLKSEEIMFGAIVPKKLAQTPTASHQYDLDVNEYYGWISVAGSINDLCIQDGKLVAVVRSCKMIVLLDPGLQTISKFKTSTCPARSASLNRNRIAVTLPDEGRIQILCISEFNELEKMSDIKTEQDCWDIAYSKYQNYICVSYIEPKSKITILRETGDKIRVLDRDMLGNKMFISPGHIALNLDETSLYVSDTGRDMVIKMSLDGKVEKVYKDENLKTPSGIMVDETGLLYVCGKNSNDIHQLTTDLSKISILLTSKDVRSPLSIAILKYRTSKCMFLGMSSNTKIKVFLLS